MEERILQLQQKKRLLAEQAIEGGMKKGAFKLGIKEMLDLFKHEGSADYVGAYEQGPGDEDAAGGNGGVLASRNVDRRPQMKRQESDLFGRRW